MREHRRSSQKEKYHAGHIKSHPRLACAWYYEYIQTIGGGDFEILADSKRAICVDTKYILQIWRVSWHCDKKEKGKASVISSLHMVVHREKRPPSADLFTFPGPLSVVGSHPHTLILHKSKHREED